MPTPTKDVFVGSPDPTITAHILTGPETDVIPASIDDFTFGEYDAAGYVNEDGVTITPSESTETIKDWSLNVIRRVLTEFDGTVSWTHLDLTVESLKNYMGDDKVQVQAADAENGTRVRAALGAGIRPIKAWVFAVKDGDRRVVVFVPHGQVSERGEIPLAASGPITLPVTLSAYPDADGNSIYIYTDDGVVAASGGQG